uniref:TRAF-type domain-containing protein n=1 Tax=Chromera velia CCMP2878 TaxID=1169474 RepID=A0A0G4ID01_9ALVE|eukprot:Cvel_105.t1-p1 / transcript=Cvel_105.t1 / gene=Cvel_105 / organism=Chromera_velia_CCMP2878 / gene_product=TNF receptor-associated factor 3, putative / transcript_product=TNF receptor-associated factor 3, putative / location=Cvel_scaffold8:107468-109516(+) / protein_length=384 / sequence_SO=supercontig / SO=protein_coding / is_pseudo=false
MLRHLLNDCEQEEFPCQHSGCDAILARSQRDEHAMVCHRRPIQCMQCKNPVPYDAMIEHQEQHCPSVPVPCPSGCGAMVLRGSVAEHLASECMEAEMQCTYAGCHRKMKRGDFEAHEREAVVDHVRKMRAELETEYVEVSVSIPDFVSKSTGQVRNEFIETLPFFFQNTPFAIRMYPKGNHWSGPSSNNVCVYVMNLSYTHGTVGRVKYSVEIANFPQSESPNRPPQTALPIQGEEALPSSSTSPPSFSSSSSVSRKEKEDDFSRGHTGRGWESFCKLSDAFTAARASPGGALELKVTMQAHRVRGRRVLVSGVRLGSSAPASIPAGLSAPPSAAAAPLSSRGRHASHHHHHLHPHSGTVLRPQTHPTDFGPSTHYLSARGASR